MQKRKCWLAWCLSIFVVVLCLFALTGCKDEKEKYYGIYKDTNTTIEIKKYYLLVDGKARRYTINNNALTIEGYTTDLHFYENGKVLSFDTIVNFDSGRITERNKNFSAYLWDYGNGGISETYMFNLDGTVTYLNTNQTVYNASGRYRIKNGVIQISMVTVLGRASTMYWYISESGDIHFTGVYVKDLDSYFDSSKTENDSSTENSSSSWENDDSSIDSSSTENRYTITYNLNGGQLPSDGVMYNYAIYNLPYPLPTPQGTGTQSFVKWTTDEAGENEIATITEPGDYTLYAHYEDSAKSLTYKYSEELQGYEVSRYTGNGKSVKIPSTYKGVAVKGIGDSVFSNCSSLTSISIPESVTYIGEDAFSGCSSLTSIVIPDSVTWICAWAFLGCSSLTSIEIPDSVTSIAHWMFQGCSSLTSVVIPDSITSIGVAAFRDCSSLTSIVIPDSVTWICDWAFSGCSSLTSIEIPDSITSIGVGAFSGCSSLTSVKIPTKITKIYQDTFQDCLALKTIIIDSSYVANVSFIGDIITYATDVYIRADITVTPSIYSVLYNNLGKETLDGVEYYHYQIKGE